MIILKKHKLMGEKKASSKDKQEFLIYKKPKPTHGIRKERIFCLHLGMMTQIKK
jgi:hypothetical protein